jgi:hypothetical protein
MSPSKLAISPLRTLKPKALGLIVPLSLLATADEIIP